MAEPHECPMRVESTVVPRQMLPDSRTQGQPFRRGCDWQQSDRYSALPAPRASGHILVAPRSEAAPPLITNRRPDLPTVSRRTPAPSFLPEARLLASLKGGCTRSLRLAQTCITGLTDGRRGETHIPQFGHAAVNTSSQRSYAWWTTPTMKPRPRSVRTDALMMPSTIKQRHLRVIGHPPISRQIVDQLRFIPWMPSGPHPSRIWSKDQNPTARPEHHPPQRPAGSREHVTGTPRARVASVRYAHPQRRADVWSTARAPRAIGSPDAKAAPNTARPRGGEWARLLAHLSTAGWSSLP
jgi:hypothetical protein